MLMFQVHHEFRNFFGIQIACLNINTICGSFATILWHLMKISFAEKLSKALAIFVAFQKWQSNYRLNVHGLNLCGLRVVIFISAQEIYEKLTVGWKGGWWQANFQNKRSEVYMPNLLWYFNISEKKETNACLRILCLIFQLLSRRFGMILKHLQEQRRMEFKDMSKMFKCSRLIQMKLMRCLIVVLVWCKNRSYCAYEQQQVVIGLNQQQNWQ